MNLTELTTADLTEAFQRNGEDTLVVRAAFKYMEEDEAIYEYSTGYGHESLLAVCDSINGMRARKYDIISRTTVAVSALVADTANGTANVVTSVPLDAAANIGTGLLDLGLDFLTRKTTAAGKMVEDLGASTLEKVSDLGESALNVLPDTSTVEAAGEFVMKLGASALETVGAVGAGTLEVAGSVVGGIAEAAGDIASGL